jgi:hypothetical protein
MAWQAPRTPSAPDPSLLDPPLIDPPLLDPPLLDPPPPPSPPSPSQPAETESQRRQATPIAAIRMRSMAVPPVQSAHPFASVEFRSVIERSARETPDAGRHDPQRERRRTSSQGSGHRRPPETRGRPAATVSVEVLNGDFPDTHRGTCQARCRPLVGSTPSRCRSPWRTACSVPCASRASIRAGPSGWSGSGPARLGRPSGPPAARATTAPWRSRTWSRTAASGWSNAARSPGPGPASLPRRGPGRGRRAGPPRGRGVTVDGRPAVLGPPGPPASAALPRTKPTPCCGLRNALVWRRLPAPAEPDARARPRAGPDRARGPRLRPHDEEVR